MKKLKSTKNVITINSQVFDREIIVMLAYLGKYMKAIGKYLDGNGLRLLAEYDKTQKSWTWKAPKGKK